MSSLRVCVTDDCVDENLILCEGLRLHGHTAVPAHTGEETLSICASGDVDLVLLDVGLPDLDGYAVCEQLKKDPSTKDIPVIFVTARGSNEDVGLGYKLGAVDYIAKPYNLPRILVCLDTVFRTHQFNGLQAMTLLDDTYTDPLTGLRNRQFLMERLQEELDKSHRHGHAISCLCLDISEINPMDSELGTASLDDLLAEIAIAVRNASRAYDVLARFDGAVFAAVLPHTALNSAIRYANKIQEDITATTFSDPSFPTQAKLSFGIVTSVNGIVRNAEELVTEAMRNLLQASAGCEEGMVARELEVSA